MGVMEEGIMTMVHLHMIKYILVMGKDLEKGPLFTMMDLHTVDLA